MKVKQVLDHITEGAGSVMVGMLASTLTQNSPKLAAALVLTTAVYDHIVKLAPPTRRNLVLHTTDGKTTNTTRLVNDLIKRYNYHIDRVQYINANTREWHLSLK